MFIITRTINSQELKNNINALFFKLGSVKYTLVVLN